MEGFIEILTTNININVWDDDSAMRDFRFTVSEIGAKTAPFVIFNKLHTKKNRYCVYLIFGTCFLLRILGSPSRRKDLRSFYSYGSQLSEVFWEVMEHLRETKFYLVGFLRTDLIASRGAKYASAIGTVAPLDK